MIAPEFYTDVNKGKSFLDGRLTHFKYRDRVIVTKSYKYTLLFGDTVYSITEDIFGKDKEYLWYIIADINLLRHPDTWEMGDVINLPEIIVVENQPIEPRNSKVISKTKIIGS